MEVKIVLYYNSILLMCTLKQTKLTSYNLDFIYVTKVWK